MPHVVVMNDVLRKKGTAETDTGSPSFGGLEKTETVTVCLITQHPNSHLD